MSEWEEIKKFFIEEDPEKVELVCNLIKAARGCTHEQIMKAADLLNEKVKERS